MTSLRRVREDGWRISDAALQGRPGSSAAARQSRSGRAALRP
ncbi:hypothetical protein [Streptomyces lasiicapitis]|nr:hypothetical protein [Streptomyces lasiicapitis]